MAGRSKILEVQDCPQLHSKFEASLGHMSSCLRKGKGRNGEWERERERMGKEEEGGGREEEGTVEESREEKRKISRQRALQRESGKSCENV